LIQIAKTPAQTAAYEQFEIARYAFRQALYLECLEALAKAIGGDHTSPGYKLEWRFHQLQGVVRLGFFGCETELVDPAQAEQSFLMAARYAKANAPAEAAKAFLSAGWSAFVQGKLPDALQYTDQAVALDANLTEALFQSAKFRMFSFITKNWRGKPLLNRATVINLIANTTTATGLQIKALDTGTYPTGKKISNQQMADLHLEPADFHGEWNYTLSPKV